MLLYKGLITITTLLGLAFVVLQCFGFATLQHHGVILLGNNSNPAASLAIITRCAYITCARGCNCFRYFFVRAYKCVALEAILPYLLK